ncbi:2-keto-4-pentenoate hydratase [Kribbella sp. NPDC051620]|uniref:2-keto-4-pentenoate hydratase n=1 Tax=Kribbella sp. NPDC051620 TaxID=3364120 RepID=UPI00379233CE
MSLLDLTRLSGRLDEAATARTTIAPLTKDNELTQDTAYQIQQRLVRARVKRGARILGGKLGLTSRAKQIAMGVHEPLYGFVTSDMLADGAALDLDRLIHPRVEPEIAFVLADALDGPGVTAADVLAATAYVCVALDVIDSRYDGFSFTHLDAIADNASSAGFALGTDLVRPTRDLSLAGCALEVDGVVVDSAAGAAVMGHPAASVAFMARALAERGERLEAGWVVLSGGLTAPVPIRPGTTVTASVAGLGSVTLTGVTA